jgi:hypothetical protein
MRHRSYMIINWSDGGRPVRQEPVRARRLRGPGRYGAGRYGTGHHGTGRHRLGAPGTVRRDPQRFRSGSQASPECRRRPFRPNRARHRRGERPTLLAARYGTLVVLLGTVGISGWFAAAGAAAFAQMIQP